MDKVQNIIKNLLDKLNLLDYQEKLSLSNITVAVFVLICAIRMLFGGSTLNILSFQWNIMPIDTAGTLPVLFGLLNYHGKRMAIAQAQNTDKTQ